MADSNRVENPRAFPRSGSFGAEGMTLRDYFAGHALAAVIMACREDTEARHGPEAYFARQSYAVADAMLIARQTPDTSR